MNSLATATEESSDASRSILSRQDSKTASGGGVDSRFCCNICLEAVVDPVATLCGHLYCWPCLFRWLEPGMYPGERASLGIITIPQQPLVSDSNHRRVCPVCKAPCSVPTLVPIYVRESDESDDSFRQREEESLMEQTTATAAATTTTCLSNNNNIDENGDSDNTNRSRESEPLTTGQNNEQVVYSDMGVAAGESITGLRQRLRFRSRRDSENSADIGSGTAVPSRPPPAQSPRHPISPPSSSSTTTTTTPHTPQRYGTNPNWVAPLTPTGHRGSLTHGLLLSIQQATTSAAGGSSRVPPLHHRSRGGSGGGHPADDSLDAQSGAASEYLSRLLLMLACFVILCLLLL